MITDKTKIVLGIFDQNQKFIGYKADSFWSLVKKDAKIHTMDAIDSLIDNYISGLKSRKDNEFLEPDERNGKFFSYRSSLENDFIYIAFATTDFENDYAFSETETLNFSNIGFKFYCIVDQKLNIYKIDDNPTFSNPENFTKFSNKQEIIHFN